VRPEASKRQNTDTRPDNRASSISTQSGRVAHQTALSGTARPPNAGGVTHIVALFVPDDRQPGPSSTRAGEEYAVDVSALPAPLDGTHLHPQGVRRGPEAAPS
jgi:hypothetical protein